MKRKRILIVMTLMLIVSLITSCSTRKDLEQMTLRDKFLYAQRLDFTFHMYYEGEWLTADRGLFASRQNHSVGMFHSFDEENDIHTELRFVHFQVGVWDEGKSEHIIYAWPYPKSYLGVINAIKWGILSEGMNLECTLEMYGLSYPLTVSNLIDDWENIWSLLYRDNDSFRIHDVGNFARVYGNEGSRIAFELFCLLNINEGREEHIYEILDSLNLTEDEGAILLRHSGSYDAFVFITNLMLEEGLSFERARRRYERETSSSNLIEYNSLHAQHKSIHATSHEL